jgi:hypothetical protein
VSDETTKERVQRLMGEAFAVETGGGECTWAYDHFDDRYTLHNRKANLAMQMTGKQMTNLVRYVDDTEWEERATKRRVVMFERVTSGCPESVTWADYGVRR